MLSRPEDDDRVAVVEARRGARPLEAVRDRRREDGVLSADAGGKPVEQRARVEIEVLGVTAPEVRRLVRRD